MSNNISLLSEIGGGKEKKSHISYMGPKQHCNFLFCIAEAINSLICMGFYCIITNALPVNLNFLLPDCSFQMKSEKAFAQRGLV